MYQNIIDGHVRIFGQCCFHEKISFVIDFNGDFYMGHNQNVRKRCWHYVQHN